MERIWDILAVSAAVFPGWHLATSAAEPLDLHCLQQLIFRMMKDKKYIQCIQSRKEIWATHADTKRPGSYRTLFVK